MLLMLFVSGCREASPGVFANAGDPLPGLDSGQLEIFKRGRDLFNTDFTPETGLGPIFNDERCASCHDLPTIGGAGADVVEKVTHFANGRCDLLTDEGGDLLQSGATEALRAHGLGPEQVPRRANAFARILAPALYGAGLIDAIPAAAILANADSADRNGDGISGRAGQTTSAGIGRFGRKATFPNLRSFVVGALQGEMGITTRDAPREELPNGKPLPAGVDLRPEPELSEQELELLVRFVEWLALSQPEEPVSPAADDSIRAGRREFRRAGCAACHIESLETGRDAPAPLGKARVDLYSDLLLHDLGPDMASVCARGAAPSEWRTTPLTGLRLRHQFMHDGRAQSVRSAIDAHGGEARASRARFQRLPPERQELLLRFLRSL